MAEARKPRAIKSKRIDPNAPASLVVTAFGGLSLFCQETGFKSSTVWGWLEKGFIPADHQPHIRAVAERLELDILAATFVAEPALNPALVSSAQLPPAVGESAEGEGRPTPNPDSSSLPRS